MEPLSARTRTMRVEIDLPNPTNLLQDGMYGEVTIHLQSPRKDVVRVPTSCLRKKGEQWFLDVVRDGRIYSQKVKIGVNNGYEVEILTGLKRGDKVIVESPGSFREGAEVEVVEEPPSGAAPR